MEQCLSSGDFIQDMAADTIKDHLSKVYGFEPRYFLKEEDDELSTPLGPRV